MSSTVLRSGEVGSGYSRFSRHQMMGCAQSHRQWHHPNHHPTPPHTPHRATTPPARLGGAGEIMRVSTLSGLGARISWAGVVARRAAGSDGNGMRFPSMALISLISYRRAHSFYSYFAVTGTLTMSLGSLKRREQRAFNESEIIIELPRTAKCQH